MIPPEILLGATLVAAGSALYSSRSWPIGVRRRVQTQTDRVDALEATVEALAAKWLQTSAELSAFLEEAEGVLSAVEKKRRRIAAHAGKVDAAEESEIASDPAHRHGQLLKLARQQGHAV